MIANGNSLYNTGSSTQRSVTTNLKGWDGGWVRGRFNREGTHVYLRLMHVVVWQKPTEHCREAIFQLKIN